MSHITNIEQTTLISKHQVHCLAQAVKNFCPQLKFIEGQTHYRTWKDDHGGRLVGDWPIPKGMTEADIGDNAHHIISMRDNHRAYEIGLVPVQAATGEYGQPKTVAYAPEGSHTHYALMTDFYNQGNGIMECQGVGRHQVEDGKDRSFEDLYMYFQMEVAKQEAMRQGDEIEFQELEDGTYKANVQTYARMGI